MLDRDGVINYDSVNYIKSPDEWHEIPGSFEAISLLTKAGIDIGVATNQSGIGRGYYNEDTLKKIHNKMLHGVSLAGGHIEKILYCPHLPDANCLCRKPKPGMLVALAKHFNSTPKGHYYIGDRKSDVLAAQSCGAIPLLIQSEVHKVKELMFKKIRRFTSLQDAAKYIINETITH